jgi:hypothetical protein
MNNEAQKKVTLEQLYQQRKANHTLPAALREQLAQQAKKKKTKRITRWQLALPIAFASIMTVVLIVPNREQFNEDLAFVAAPQSLPSTNAPGAANRSSEISSTFTIAAEQTESDLSYESAPAEAKTKALKSTGSTPPLEELMMSDSVNEISAADAIEQPESPVILLVINGPLGQFENCDQEPVELDAKTDLESWIKATWVEGEWRFERTDDGDCY